MYFIVVIFSEGIDFILLGDIVLLLRYLLVLLFSSLRYNLFVLDDFVDMKIICLLFSCIFIKNKYLFKSGLKLIIKRSLKKRRKLLLIIGLIGIEIRRKVNRDERKLSFFLLIRVLFIF